MGSKGAAFGWPLSRARSTGLPEVLADPGLHDIEIRDASGRSSVWLERLHGVQEVAGSNPVAPTILKKRPFGKDVEGLSL